MDKTKVKVTMEIEVEEFDLFMTSLQSGLIAFSEETKANILKTEIKENEDDEECLDVVKETDIL